MVAVRPFERAIADVAKVALAALVADFDIDTIGVAGAPDRDLAKIGSEHIRAHAAEGILYRHAVELAARSLGIACVTISDRHAPQSEVLKSLGKAAGRPWRADERLAASAALHALSAQR